MKRRGWKEWKWGLVSRESERRAALPPPNRTGQLCTFPSRSDRPCGFTLDMKLLQSERRTSEGGGGGGGEGEGKMGDESVVSAGCLGKVRRF